MYFNLDGFILDNIRKFWFTCSSLWCYGVFSSFLVIKYILESVVGQVSGMHGMIMALENRVKNMNNDMIKLDIQISDALNLRQDEERISRADGKEDARRD